MPHSSRPKPIRLPPSAVMITSEKTSKRMTATAANAIAIVMDTIVASESMPSMKFMAFITPMIQIIDTSQPT